MSAVSAFSTHLSGSDSVLWSIERDPSLRTTIVGVSLLDRAPEWRRLRSRVEQATRDIPRMRQRVSAPILPLLTPRWEDVAHLDLDYHLRHVVCPEPGTVRDVLDVAAPIAMATFDRERPLWEFTLVEGLAGGRAAFVQKLHHAVTDGVGAIHLARALLDDTRSGRSRRVRSLDDVARDRPQRPPLRPHLSPALLSPRGLVRGATSVGKLVVPTPRPLSPLMVERGAGRHLDAIDLPLHELSDAAHAAGCTLNDAFLAGVTEGLRRYHDRHGTTLRALRINMPVNLRRAGDPPGANRFVPVRMVVPVDAAGAPERMRRLGAIARAWRDEPALPATGLISSVITRLHPILSTAVMGGMLKGVDVVASNIPGFSRPAFLAGSEVTRQYAFGPPSGGAVNVALVSHLDRCCLGVNVDTAAVPDADVLLACLLEGFDDVVGGRAVSALRPA